MAMPAERRILRKVIRENPCSLRRLAQEASVSHANLLAAAEGRRPVSSEMARQVVAALRKWAAMCNRLADELEAVSD
jgi:hypothetical protein